MISFKQYLYEEEETDKRHKVHKQAAEAFMQHCKQWKDVNAPLYRLSTVPDGGHTMRSRVPRTRKDKSMSGQHKLHALIFEQEGWESYPARAQSIFCSTTRSFKIHDPNPDNSNLLMIYPYDGVKLACTVDDPDFNFINLFNNTEFKKHIQIMDFSDYMEDWYQQITGRWSSDWLRSMGALKEIFSDKGYFDENAKGDEEMANRYEYAGQRARDAVKVIVEKFPQHWTPQNLGCELVTSGEMKLPGKQREVWFSGKYLVVPYADHKKFVEEVKALQA